MRTLFLAWQDQKLTRRWFVVGRLDREGETYSFQYVRQVKKAIESGFSPLLEFPEIEKAYDSEALFPVFTNRLMPKSREDYESFLKRLSIKDSEVDPFLVLGRTEGLRTTDNLEVFLKPEPNSSNRFDTHFFVRGIRHIEKIYNPDVEIQIRDLQPGDPLEIRPDRDNPQDVNALHLLHAAKPIGWVPRYLCHDVNLCISNCGESAIVKVAQLNPPPAPVHQRLLCHFDAPWPSDKEPFSDEEFQGLVKQVG
jgi:hypothetical protein